MKPFDDLTKQGQTRRLRPLALEALKAYPIKVEKLRLIQNSWNATYRIDTIRGKTYMMRVNRPGPGAHTMDELQAEMAWVDALHRETQLGVPQPLANNENSFISTAEAPGVPEPRYCLLFSWLPGKVVADVISPEVYFKLGQVSAQLHLHAKKLKLPKPKALRVYDTVFPFQEDNVLFDPVHKKLFPGKRRNVYAQAVERVQTEIDALYANRRGLRVIHNDLHHWNVMVHRGKLSPFDFEDLMWGFPIQDVATTLMYVQYNDHFSDLLTSFRQGYETQTDWPERFSNEIQHHIAARRLMLVNYVLQSSDLEEREYAPKFVKIVEDRLKDYLKKL